MSTLIIRFSPISNVAMLVPLLESMTRLQPNEKFVVVSRTFLQPLFADLPNTTFIGVDLRNQHKGAIGTLKLLKEINIRFSPYINLLSEDMYEYEQGVKIIKNKFNQLSK